MKIAISGANGFLGSYLAEEFIKDGAQVIKLVRVPEGKNEYKFILGEVIDESILSGVDCLIHAAYDLSASSWGEIYKKNVSGSEILFEACRKAKVKNIILISSMSAFDNAKSNYGKAKLKTESILFKYYPLNSYVLRPGVIYGENHGGLIGKLRNMAKLPVLPVVGGEVDLYFTHLKDLYNFIGKIANDNFINYSGTSLIVANSKPVKFKLLLRSLGAKFIVQCPFILIWGMLKSLELLGFKLKSGSDNLLSLVNQNKKPYFDPQVTKYFREFL